MLISVSNKEAGEVTVRAQWSMKKSQKPHCLSVRESHPTGSVQAHEKQVSVCQIKFLLHVIAAN